MKPAFSVATMTVALALSILAAPSAASGLTTAEARQVIHEGLDFWAATLDGTLAVRSCQRRGPTRIRCQAQVRGARQICDFHGDVSERPGYYLLRQFGVRCR